MSATSSFAPSVAAAASVPGGFVAPSARVASLTARPRFVVSRPIEKTPPKYGEKPYEQMVKEAFDGPVLRLSRRITLLETAAERHIRRGDALDVIAAVKREIEAKHGARPATPLAVFAGRYAAFVAVYAVVALAWCLVVGAHS